MSTYIAELQSTSSALSDAPDSMLGSMYGHEAPDNLDEMDRSMGTVRGIVSAILISLPFWALFAFAVYLVM